MQYDKWLQINRLNWLLAFHAVDHQHTNSRLDTAILHKPCVSTGTTKVAWVVFSGDLLFETGPMLHTVSNQKVDGWKAWECDCAMRHSVLFALLTLCAPNSSF